MTSPIPDRVILDIPGSTTAPVASYDAIALAYIQQQHNIVEVYLSGAQTIVVENHSPWDALAMILYGGASSAFPVVVPRQKSKTISTKGSSADSMTLSILQDRPLILQSLSEWVDPSAVLSTVPGYQVAGYIPPGFITVTGMTDEMIIGSAVLDEVGAEPVWYTATQAVVTASSTGSILLTGFARGIVRIDLWNRSDGDLYFILLGKVDNLAATKASSGWTDTSRKEIYLASGEYISLGDIELDPVTTLSVRNPQGVDAGYQFLTWGS